jgi:hypothetical protein
MGDRQVDFILVAGGALESELGGSVEYLSRVLGNMFFPCFLANSMYQNFRFSYFISLFGFMTLGMTKFELGLKQPVD